VSRAHYSLQTRRKISATLIVPSLENKITRTAAAFSLRNSSRNDRLTQIGYAPLTMD
jgi:hypothetical protein